MRGGSRLALAGAGCRVLCPVVGTVHASGPLSRRTALLIIVLGFFFSPPGGVVTGRPQSFEHVQNVLYMYSYCKFGSREAFLRSRQISIKRSIAQPRESTIILFIHHYHYNCNIVIPTRVRLRVRVVPVQKVLQSKRLTRWFRRSQLSQPMERLARRAALGRGAAVLGLSVGRSLLSRMRQAASCRQ